MAKKKAAAVINTVSVAVLDDMGFYQGVEHIAASELTPEHVQVAADCDLEKGRYYWDKKQKAFFPDRDCLLLRRKQLQKLKIRGSK